MGAVLEAMFVKVSALPGGADCFSEEEGFCEASAYGMLQVLGLGAAYAAVLSHGSGLISDGAELLQVVPSLEHLVGSVVLPVLGSVPDCAIILFSGLSGARAQAQEQLSVGVGALAGSSILLLTIPWAVSILAGRVEVGANGRAIYRRPHGWKTAEHGKWTKLRTPLSARALATTGVSCEPAVAESARALGLTAALYLLIQAPAMTRSWRTLTAPADDASALAVAAFERPYAIGALVGCTVAFGLYLVSKARGADHDVVRTYKVEEARIALIKQGRLTLVGAMAHLVDRLDDASRGRAPTANGGGGAPPSAADELRGPLVPLEAQSAAHGGAHADAIESERAVALAEIRDTLRPFFKRYDADGSHSIDGAELRVLFADLHEKLGVVEIAAFAGVGAAHGLPEALDDASVEISFDAFVDIVIAYVRRRGSVLCAHGAQHLDSYREAEAGLIASAPPPPDPDDDDDEHERDDDDDDEMPDELRDLPPEEQHRRAKASAGRMLVLGTAIVVAFSDPMVGVLSEVARRTGVPAFYVAFVLAPVASNGAEILSAYTFAKRKTERATTTAFSTLLGAAVMNNTFCLAVFMALIVARGDLYWEYTAETLSILAVELAMVCYGRKRQFTLIDGLCIGLLYPAGLALVIGLEALGLD